MYFHIRGEADAVSPMVVFAVSGSCCACAFRGAVGRRKRQPFPLPKRAWRATCASGGSMDGRRFGRAPKSAAFSRGDRLKMAGSMSEAALGTFCCARCTRNRPPGRPFPVQIVNGFHPPKVAKRKLTPRGGVAARSPPALFRKRAFEDRKRAPHDRKRGNAASSKVPAGVFERRPCLFSRHFWRARKEKAAKAPFFASQHVSRDPFAIALALMTPPHFRAKPVPPRPANVHRPRDR